VFTLAVFGVAAAAALIAAWQLSEERRLTRRMRRTPVGPVAEAVDGSPCRLVGTVAAGRTIFAPISGRLCVAYQIRVFEVIGEGLRHYFDDEGGIPFVIEDGTGRALVDPERARMALELDDDSTSGPHDTTPRHAAFLAHLGRSDQRPGGRIRLQYHEGIVAPGDPVAVLGHGVREPDPAAIDRIGGYRAGAPTRLRISGTARWPVLISDRPEARC
jgi:hypothetical protein